MRELSKLGTFAILLTSSLTIMVGTVLAPSLTGISKHLGFAESPGWLITLPSLGVVLFAPIIGKLIDKKGPYVMIYWGLIPYALLGVLGAVLSNSYVVVADRLLLGAATAAIQSSSSSLIAEFFDSEKRMKMMARQGMSIEIGGVAFLSIGGVLGEIDWHLPFLIYLLGIICAILIVLYIPRFDSEKAKKSVRSEANPLFNKGKYIISKEVLTFCVCSMLSMTLFFVVFVGLPQYLPEAFNFSESYTGYFMAFISLVAVVFAGQMPKMSKWIGSNNTVSIGFLLFSLGLFFFSLAGTTLVLFLAALAMGAGFGFTVPLLNHLIVEHSDATNRGRNLSYYSIAIFGGQFLSSFLGMLSSNYRAVFSVSAFLALIVCITLFYKNRPPKIEVAIQ